MLGDADGAGRMEALEMRRALTDHGEDTDRQDEWEALRQRHLSPEPPPSTAGGV